MVGPILIAWILFGGGLEHIINHIVGIVLIVVLGVPIIAYQILSNIHWRWHEKRYKERYWKD